MPRNGSGGYSAPTNSWNPATVGNSATPPDFNALLSDIATAISQSIAADGQTPITANIPMGGNKLTGLAQGVASGDSLSWEQLFSQGVETDVASAATCDIGVVNSAFIRITGTATITSFGTNYRGPRFIRFGGALQLTHNASTLILPGGRNITTIAGECAIVRPIGSPASGWIVIAYQRSSEFATLGANTFTGPQTLPGNASSALHAVPKQQLDADLAAGLATKANTAGSASQVFSVATATNSAHAVNLGQFPSTKTSNGTTTLPNGLIAKFGRISTTVGSAGTVTFGTAFPSSVYMCTVSFETGSGVGYVGRHRNLTNSGFIFEWDNFNTSGAGSPAVVNFIAIGE